MKTKQTFAFNTKKCYIKIKLLLIDKQVDFSNVYNARYCLRKSILIGEEIILNFEMQLKAMDVLVHVHTAIKNVHSYASDSPVITNSIERIYFYLMDILRDVSPLVFTESGNQALLCGELLKQKDQESIHVANLLNIMQEFSLQSISFARGLSKEELNVFIRLIARDPEQLRAEGGLAKLMEKNNIFHIQTEKKELILSIEQVEKTAQPDISHHELPALNAIQQTETADDPVLQSIAEMTKALTRLGDMDGSIESFISEEQREVIKKLSEQVIEWLETETVVTPEYKTIIDRLQKLVQDFIYRGLFAEANSFISIFSRINTGELPKDDSVRETSLSVLRNLASENNINLLFREINVSEKNKTTDAFHILAGFGDDLIIKKLLDTVRNAKDSKERIRTIHIIQEMGRKTIPAIKESMTSDAPWYYLRNMAYILGRIGRETDTEVLRPLLLYKDKRVRMEAFKSISQIGGDKRGPLFLSVLTTADPELKINIIEMLGKIKSTEAVPNLLEMLKNKAATDKSEQLILQEKICDALGAIGSPDAIPALTDITESKSFLGISSYPTEIKYAAKRALASIKRNQAG